MHAQAHVQPSPPHASSALRPSGALRLAVCWATSAHDLHEAQALRYRVFVTEMGAQLAPPAGTAAGLDADYFDPYCDHLLVRAINLANPSDSQVVGTYRVLPPAAARRAGGFYADTEFDLAPLTGLRPQAVELGRACVHPDWRSGAVIMSLWGALCRYMLERRLDTMIGCASIGLANGAGEVDSLWQSLSKTHLVAPRWRVKPYRPLLLGAAATGNDGRRPVVPPLIRGYLRCGARLLGPPAYDAAFNTADLPMMMRLEEMPLRHRAHFLRG